MPLNMLNMLLLLSFIIIIQLSRCVFDAAIDVPLADQHAIQSLLIHRH